MKFYNLYLLGDTLMKRVMGLTVAAVMLLGLVHGAATAGETILSS